MILRKIFKVFSEFPPRFRAKDPLKIALIIALNMPLISKSDGTCQGKYVNPISDICWSCLMPISIGDFNIGKGGKPKKRDTKNPSSPLCMCTKANIPTPGISIGFWEPTRLIDITRTPYCMTNLGGLDLGLGKSSGVSSYSRGYGKHHSHKSFYHVHYYIYPLIYWLELITDFMCLEQSSFDVAYISELDVMWNDESLQTLMHPESILFGNPIAQSACIIDCAAASFSMPRDELFWCSGCWGNIYPFSGANADHVGGVQNSSLLSTRIIAKMHRMGLAMETSTNENTKLTGGGKLCRKSRAFKIKKSQYKLQMVNPKTTVSGIGCFPLGLSDMMYSAFKEFPMDGEDFGYLVWRKVNCCAM